MEENQGWSDGGFPVAGVAPVLEKYKVKVQISDRPSSYPRNSGIVTTSVLCSFIPGGEKAAWPVATPSVSRSWFVFLIYSMKWLSLMACH